MNEIQKIHAAFEFDILTALVKNSHDEYIETLRPEGVKPERFNQAVAEYRMTYPQNNFVTERQIVDVCAKHGLFSGSLLAFSGKIPVRNRSQMMNFKLSDRHREISLNGIPSRIVAEARNSQRANTRIVTPPEYSTAPAYFEFSSGFIPADMEKPFKIIPVGGNFLLFQIGGSTEYKIFYETTVFGSPWLVEFGVGSISYGSVLYIWRKQSQSVHHANVSLRLTIDKIQQAKRVDLSSGVSPVVVAPRSMFARFGNVVEAPGHRIKFTASTFNEADFRVIDDPIVLQPVPFGYLVVTKWGAESNFPEIQPMAENRSA